MIFQKKDSTANKSRIISLNIPFEEKELQDISYQFNASRNYDQPLIKDLKFYPNELWSNGLFKNWNRISLLKSIPR